MYQIAVIPQYFDRCQKNPKYRLYLPFVRVGCLSIKVIFPLPNGMNSTSVFKEKSSLCMLFNDCKLASDINGTLTNLSSEIDKSCSAILSK